MYKRAGMVTDPVEGTYSVSITFYGDNRVKFHSRASKYVEGSFPESFLHTLRLFTNQNMWDYMYLYDNREWITEAILNSTLDGVHNGSYQPEVTKYVCSTEVWVQCRATQRQIIVSVAEKSLHASRYRSEILGVSIAKLILRAATRNVPAQYQEVPTYCDNNWGAEPRQSS